MATAVESPGIASAKEEAAAILFARQPQTPPVTLKTPVLETAPTAPTQPARPQFASYHDPMPMPTRPTAVDTATFRPYQNFDDVPVVSAQPQVVRPYIDSGDYLSSAVAATSVDAPAPTPVATSVAAPKTVTVAHSALDTELEEDTQYVVKFKNSTIVAATIIATIFLLLAVLCVVNIVTLVTASAEVNALWNESAALNQSLDAEKASLEQSRQEVTANGSTATHTIKYETLESSGYTAPTDTPVHGAFFDWLCHALSQLFG
ncbi:MAG: hypothetical protein NC133_01015 [Prevotella sp.]|nr:hypothetical protein [Prevotella sp.]